MRKTVLIAMLTLLPAWGSAWAGNAYLTLRENHWVEAMTLARVDSDILYAISLMESGTTFKGMREFGPWPWVMNINHEPKFYSSREAARRALAKEVEKGNENVAVGMWQIYLRYNGHYVDDPLDLVDPVTNLYVASMVLRGCGDIYDTVESVLSCYYSGDVDEAGLAYAKRVLRLAEKFGEPFRLKNPPAGVRYTHGRELEKEPMQVVRVVDTPSNVSEVDAPETAAVAAEHAPAMPPSGAAAISMAMLADAKAPQEIASHEDFLEHIEPKPDAGGHRVIVLD